MIIYYSTPLELRNIYKDLQSKRTSSAQNKSNFLGCPAVRDSWRNVFSLNFRVGSVVTYALEGVSRSGGLPISLDRKPQLTGTNIFNLLTPSHFFCEQPLEMKVTAPYFHHTSYLGEGALIGGVFDIGRWFRPIQIEIITWQEKGHIEFKKNEPIAYIQFMTNEEIIFRQFEMNQIIESLAGGLVSSPFQVEGIPQGGLESRYEAFENSDYRKGLIEEIKAALVSDES